MAHTYFSVLFYPTKIPLAAGWTFRGWNPGGEKRFLWTPVQTSLGAHSALFKTGTRTLSGGVKRPGRGVDNASPRIAMKFRQGIAIPLFLCAFMACYRETFTFN
jgi:hypothetical protein